MAIALPTEPFAAYLFRHDTSISGDIAEVELRDMSVKLRVSVIAQIAESNDATTLSPKAFWKAFYLSPGGDPIKGTELILNPRIKEAYNKEPLEVPFSGDKDTAMFSETGVISVTQRQLLYNLGLRYPEQGEGDFILVDTSSPMFRSGEDIIRQLRGIGVGLKDISLDDLELPPEVAEARQSIGITESQSAAELLKAQKQEEIQTQINKNLVLQRKGEAEARRVESMGFVTAINEAAQASNGKITEKQFFEVLVQYPAMEKVLGDKAKVFFTGGGAGGDLKSLILQALQGSQD